MTTLIDRVVGGVGVTCGVTYVKVGDTTITYANIQEKNLYGNCQTFYIVVTLLQ